MCDREGGPFSFPSASAFLVLLMLVFRPFASPGLPGWCSVLVNFAGSLAAWASRSPKAAPKLLVKPASIEPEPDSPRDVYVSGREVADRADGKAAVDPKETEPSDPASSRRVSAPRADRG